LALKLIPRARNGIAIFSIKYIYMKISRKVIALFSLVFLMYGGQAAAQEAKRNPFVVFNNGIADQQLNTPEKQVKLLKSLGYDGMEKKGLDGFAETLAALDKHGLKMYTMYLNIDLDNKQQPYDKRLKETFRMLQGSETMPWFYITSKQYKPSSQENDSIAVPILQEIADMANEYGIKVMIYPHVNFWVDNVEDALRVAGKVNRRNLGITFNLCHYLADQGTQADKAFIPLVEKAMPYLFAVSLNGADKPTDAIMQSSNLWQYFIQPLGQGNFNTFQYLNAFIARGFEGPVGLQCYSIKEEKPVHLKKSSMAWKDFERKLAAKR
jgi:sugar phosphate isomerase/epimerase